VPCHAQKTPLHLPDNQTFFHFYGFLQGVHPHILCAKLPAAGCAWQGAAAPAQDAATGEEPWYQNCSLPDVIFADRFN